MEKRGVIRLRVCRACGKKFNKPTRLFLLDPEVWFQPRVAEIYSEEGMGGRVVRLETKVEINFQLREEITVSGYSKSKLVNLGGRGQVTSHFHNTAVKICEKWYLVGALPGRESSVEDLSAS